LLVAQLAIFKIRSMAAILASWVRIDLTSSQTAMVAINNSGLQIASAIFPLHMWEKNSPIVVGIGTCLLCAISRIDF
jgi:hypothetical protein